MASFSWQKRQPASWSSSVEMDADRLRAAYPELQYTPDSLVCRTRGLHYRFFDVMVDPVTRRYLSEDYGFCRLWSALGESICDRANSRLGPPGQQDLPRRLRDLAADLPAARGRRANGTETPPAWAEHAPSSR